MAKAARLWLLSLREGLMARRLSWPQADSEQTPVYGKAKGPLYRQRTEIWTTVAMAGM